MAYTGKCACGDIKFKFELDPMMHFMCHCTDCQVMFNGSFEGYAISKDELSIEGDLSKFSYSGGSGLSLHVNFCSKCSTKIYTQPDILEGMIYVPAGLLRDQIEFKPKVEIWAGSRPSWTSRPESLAESFDDNGTVERISTLLENLDQRT
jgi:hypothetical protein